MLKHVRKMEARKQGAESQRRRPMVELEFATMMKVFLYWNQEHVSYLVVWNEGTCELSISFDG